MKLKKLSKRERNIFALTVGIVLFVLIFHLFINPFLDKMDGVNQEIQRKTKLLERYSGLLSRGEDAHLLYAKYKNILEKDEKPQEIIANLFKEIENSANKYGVKIKRIKPLPISEKKEYKEAFLEVELEGDFSSLFKFINHLENSSSLIKISSLRLLSGPKGSSGVLCRLTLFKIIF
jgi:Tfp pilus assembly protein PilO